MKRLLLTVICVFAFASFASAEVKLNGLFRNDFLVTGQTNIVGMSDVLENRLVFSRRADDWRFYTDLRVYLLYGDAAQMPVTFTVPPLTSGMDPVSIQTNLNIPINLNLMRAFVRFYLPIGDFTLGKTYVNFGKKGAFNLFEMNKGVNFSDLSYDKEGILALMWDSGSDVLEVRSYVSPQKKWTNTSGGFSLETHLGTFDLGMVYNRKRYDRNVAGVYFQGDLELGVHGSWAYHCDDAGNYPAHEANLGVDYSFLGGKLYLAADYYFSDGGATNTNDYVANSDEDRFLQATHYGYASVAYTPDEFLSAQVAAFLNIVDRSILITPMVRDTLFDGLDLTLQAGFPVGTDGAEFDPKKLGKWNVDVRCEAKL